MRLRNFYRTFSSTLLILVLFVNALPQYTLGPQALTSYSVPPLKEPGRVTMRGGRPAKMSLRFLRGVGGVSFDGTASSEDGTVVKEIEIGYSPKQLNGKRLSLSVNGLSVAAPIHDWQLIPIAKFADSEYYSCFTLTGDELDEKYKYHEAFNDTLLGLRLFQLDMLLINDYSYDLPKLDGKYILGAGEVAPNIGLNREGHDALFNYNEKSDTRWSSYLISNINRNTTFGTGEGVLKLSESPSYFFWGVNQQKLIRLYDKYDDVIVDARKLIDEEKKSIPANELKDWLVKTALTEFKKYKEEIDSDGMLKLFKTSQRVQEILKVPNEQRETFLKNKSTDELLVIVTEFRAFRDALTPVPKTEFSETFSSQTVMLRKANPAVWDAGVNVMRYSAFFRYVKENHPIKWKAFMTQINKAPNPGPTVKTPNHIDMKIDYERRLKRLLMEWKPKKF